MMEFVAVIFALCAGAALGWIAGKRRGEKGALEAERQLERTFQSLSSEALAQNNRSFLDLAQANLEKYQEAAQSDLNRRQQAIGDLVKPVQQTLNKFESKIQELEKARTAGQVSLKEQLSSLVGVQQQLRQETTKLASALKATAVRGRWGEIQLRRVVELAGMVSHCDFYEQQTAEGGKKRPDMLVRLPAGRQIIVDAKAPLDAYLEACEVEDEGRRTELMRKHAQQIRYHVKALASKRYAEYFGEAAEFVVLFLPGETFFSAALAHDPSLIEIGADQGVIIATPTTLIALLRAVFHGWKQEAISENARKISDLGHELYKRLSSMGQHWAKVGKSLDGAVRAYNEAVGSLERRVLPKAREFEKLEGQASSLETLSQIEQTTRALQSPELTP